MAVIGHNNNQQAIKGSLVYDQANLLYIAPLITKSSLTKHGGTTSIQTMASKDSQTKYIVDFAYERNLTNILILKPKNQKESPFIPIHHKQINSQKNNEPLMKLTTRSYTNGTTDFQEFIVSIKSLKFDAIFITDTFPYVAHLIKEIRFQNITVPILGINYLDSDRLFNIAGKLSNDVYIASIYSNQETIRKGDFYDGNFEQDYLDFTGKKANYISAKAYESIYLLAQVWTYNRKINTKLNSSTFRAKTHWDGLYSDLDFSHTGQIINHPLLIKRSFNQQFKLEQ